MLQLEIGKSKRYNHLCSQVAILKRELNFQSLFYFALSDEASAVACFKFKGFVRGAQGEGEYLGTLWKIRVPLETPSHNWPINPEISLSQKMRREQRQCQHQ